MGGESVFLKGVAPGRPTVCQWMVPQAEVGRWAAKTGVGGLFNKKESEPIQLGVWEAEDMSGRS